ncbi:hypothetical protein V8E36_004854 [Tilletia maclaganii]
MSGEGIFTPTLDVNDLDDKALGKAPQGPRSQTNSGSDLTSMSDDDDTTEMTIGLDPQLKIHTADGLREVGQLRRGDLVLGRMGELRPVLATGKAYVTVTYSTLLKCKTSKTRLTPNTELRISGDVGLELVCTTGRHTPYLNNGSWQVMVRKQCVAPGEVPSAVVEQIALQHGAKVKEVEEILTRFRKQDCGVHAPTSIRTVGITFKAKRLVELTLDIIYGPFGHSVLPGLALQGQTFHISPGMLAGDEGVFHATAHAASSKVSGMSLPKSSGLLLGMEVENNEASPDPLRLATVTAPSSSPTTVPIANESDADPSPLLLDSAELEKMAMDRRSAAIIGQWLGDGRDRDGEILVEEEHPATLDLERIMTQLAAETNPVREGQGPWKVVSIRKSPAAHGPSQQLPLKNLRISATWNATSTKIINTLSVLLRPRGMLNRKDLGIPTKLLNAPFEVPAALFGGIVNADGCRHDNGSICLVQASVDLEKNVDDFKILAEGLGLTVSSVRHSQAQPASFSACVTEPEPAGTVSRSRRFRCHLYSD